MEKSRHFSRCMGRWLITLLLVMLTSLAARAAEAYACYTSSNTTLTFYYDNYRSSQSGTTYSLNTGNNDPGWYTDRTCNEVTRVIFTFSFANAHPTTTYRWFCGMNNLETITGISELNTSDVTNMGDMFNGCGLENIDLSNFNTAKVTDMSYMFYNCTYLKGLYLNNFNTARVTNMSGMFGLCTSLTLLDLRYLNTSQVTDMSNMFYNCSHLKNLHLSTLNTANVTDMSYMFTNCDELETLNLSSFNTANVTDMHNMFNGCSSLTSLDLSSFNTANVTNMSYMFTGCWRLDNLDLSSFNTANVTNMRGMFSGCSSLCTIYVGNEWSTANVTESGSMFYSCYYLQGGAGTAFDESNPTDKTYAHIDGGQSNPGYLTGAEAYVVYNVENEALYFHYDRERHNHPNTASLDLEGNHPTEPIDWEESENLGPIKHIYFMPSFADARPTSTTNWFEGLSQLEDITGMDLYLNTSQVTEMTDMFMGCERLTSLDVSGFNTANVTNMSYMFFGCSSLTSLDLSGFNTENVKDMYRMFESCTSLRSLDMSSFNTSNVIEMSLMFQGCENLTELDLSNFNTANVTDMNSMFYACMALASLDLSSFNTANVTDMGGMFGSCPALTSLDLSSFNTANVTNMINMFSGCNYLTTIYVGSGWNTAAVTRSSNMFKNCNNLVGDHGTTYNASHVDKAYAHLDGGPSNPGYLSVLPNSPYACYTPGNTTLTFYYDNQRNTREGTTYDLNEGNNRPAWVTNGTSATVTRVVFDPSFADARPTTTCDWFYHMYNLTAITGMKEYLNTSEVTNMASMFGNCSALTSLDLSSFNTEAVTTMQSMFAGCNKFTSLDLSSFNTENVINMKSMFNSCPALTSLDLSSFNTAQVTDMDSMFYGCRTLRTINVSPGWTTDAVTASDLMFKSCNNLVGCEGTIYSSSHTDKAYAHIDGGPSNPGYLSAPRGAYAVYTPENTTLTFYFDALKGTRAGTTYDLNEGYNDPAWYTDGTCTSVTRVVFDDSFGSGTTTTYSWFKSMRNLRTISGFMGSGNAILKDVTNAAYMFQDCVKLDSLNVAFSSVYNNHLVDARGMFSGCTGLKSLNIMIDCEDVANMEDLFKDCSSLTSLELHNFNTANVTSMKSMFQGCSSLQNLDLHNFNTAKVTDMSNMFRSCSALKSLDLTGWNTAKVTNMSYMFNGCSELLAIYVGNGWTTAAVTSSTGMFTGCTNLVGSAGTTYSSSHTNKAYAHIDGGTNNPGYLSTALPKPYSVFTPDNTTLTLYYDALSETRAGNVYEVIDGQSLGGDDTYSITHVEFMPSFAEARPTSTSRWFFDMMSLESITGLEYLNTEEVTDMSMMFIYCTDLESLDLSSFNTDNVTYMDGMFAYCENLQAIDLSSFNTANVTSMSQMFSGCISLTSLDLSSFNTAQVTDMSGIFDHCGNLTTIYVGPGWSTAAVTSSYGMFEECTKLKGGQGTAYNASHTDAAYAHVDGGSSNPGYLSGKAVAYACLTEPDSTLTFYYDNQWPYRAGTTFDMNTGSDSPGWNQDPYYWLTAHVKFDPSYADARPTSTHGWFSDFVQTIEGLEYLNTSEVTDMSNMFVFMGLDNIDVSHFNTAKVTNMTAMFAFTPVTTLDLSSWNTENVTNMTGMFYSCQNLTTIYAGSGWSTAAVTASDNMFDFCTSLVGGMGTTYDESHVDAAYAHIDGGTSNPGYFTEKVPEAYACYTADNTTLVFYFDLDRSSREGTTYDLNTGNHQPDWVSDETYRSVTQVMIDPSFADARPTSTHMWFFCMENVTSIAGINYLNTTEVTDMAAMFMECNSLTSLDLSHFNTAKVTDMFHMFYGCRNLTSVNLSSFNTAKVADMRGMFRYCSMLTSLDLSSFNTAKVHHMGMMFLQDSNLSTVYVGSGWSTASINVSADMFLNCTSLVGGKGTTYDANHVDAEYAHIDGGTSNPGYFTEKPTFQRGDVNRDGFVDVADVTTLIAIILNSQPVDHAIADLNDDGEIDVSDVTNLIAIILSNK